jgi:hypothetical protein
MSRRRLCKIRLHVAQLRPGYFSFPLKIAMFLVWLIGTAMLPGAWCPRFASAFWTLTWVKEHARRIGTGFGSPMRRGLAHPFPLHVPNHGCPTLRGFRRVGIRPPTPLSVFKYPNHRFTDSLFPPLQNAQVWGNHS